MIKKLMTWIFGEKTVDTAAATAPYKVESKKDETVTIIPVADGAIPMTFPASAIATNTVEVKPKFKKAELSKMTKKELLDLAANNGITVKARSTKDELVQAILKS